MPGDFVGFAIDGLPQLQKILSGLSEDIQDAVVDELNKYFVNVMQTEQAPPRYVTRAAAYGVTFFTDKQRKWFFANLNEGNIEVPYKRTQAMRNGWKIEGQGRRSFVYNDTPGVAYVMDDEMQSGHEEMVGWKKVSAVLKDHAQKAERKLVGIAEKIMRKRGAK